MLKFILITLAILVLGAGCSRVAQRDRTPSPSIGAPIEIPPTDAPSPQFGTLPNLTLSDYEGNTVRLRDFGGQPLVVNAWAAWCPFCRRELKDFVAAQKEVGDRVVFIAIDRAEDLATAKRYTDELNVTGELLLLLDPKDSFYQSIGGFSMPETIFVDARGNIAQHRRGPMDLNEIRERTQRLLVQ